jgi:hypothetical protein
MRSPGFFDSPITTAVFWFGVKFITHSFANAKAAERRHAQPIPLAINTGLKAELQPARLSEPCWQGRLLQVNANGFRSDSGHQPIGKQVGKRYER